MKKDVRHVIWSNVNMDYEDWRGDLEEWYPDVSEDERHELMYELNGEYLDDERANLNILFSQPILAIADLGLWNGRHIGYKEIQSGNISDCLYSDTDYTEWYVDWLGDLRADAIHHDGTNHYLYRVWKDGTSDVQKANLIQKIYDGKVARSDIVRLTDRIGDCVAGVYGWKVRNAA